MERSNIEGHEGEGEDACRFFRNSKIVIEKRKVGENTMNEDIVELWVNGRLITSVERGSNVVRTINIVFNKRRIFDFTTPIDIIERLAKSK